MVEATPISSTWQREYNRDSSEAAGQLLDARMNLLSHVESTRSEGDDLAPVRALWNLYESYVLSRRHTNESEISIRERQDYARLGEAYPQAVAVLSDLLEGLANAHLNTVPVVQRKRFRVLEWNSQALDGQEEARPYLARSRARHDFISAVRHVYPLPPRG